MSALELGDFLPDIQLVNQRGRVTVLSRRMLGKAGVLLVYPDHDKPACQELLRSFIEAYPRLEALAHVFAVTGEAPEANATGAQRLGLPLPYILSDPEGRAAAALGVAHNGKVAGDFLGSGAFSVFVTDASRRLIRIERGLTDKGFAEDMVDFLEKQPARETRLMGPTAPVLYIPRVLDAADCGRLIEIYETRGNQASGALTEGADGQGAERFDDKVKIRRDHNLRDPEVMTRIGQRLERRVVPEIFKAFFYRATYHEPLKLACYVGSDQGFFAPHRDNVTANSAHRRFAMTLNLNTGDYEGGALRFPEYGPELYAPAAGDAVIFSCSLLHEATPVTRGKRYALLTFLYGEEGRGQQQPQAGAGRPA